ncbi:helix-turn-helix transcriptional regulator [Bengtsoniella intestinalis]|uniref:helix-turn-helix transcriptional regulator n=1 Tax=Bengtsoniella intestinalis TaxID=3073143 RepID=UPI00391FA1D5
MLRQVAVGIATQFGNDCEVVVHDLSKDIDSSIVAIENGHVSGRSVGDGASSVVLEQMEHLDSQPQDHYSYLTRTPDGKILKSSTMYIRNHRGKVGAILAINLDISKLLMVEDAIKPFISTQEQAPSEPEKIVNVKDLLDDLIEQSTALVGKPVALMTKDDKVRAIQFLNQNGAFLVTKAGDKIAKYFSISKYTLYSYIDNKQEAKSHD